MQLMIHRGGTVNCLYAETVDLHQLGSLRICRGSHVEPDTCGYWHADLSPVEGPVLGPFESRSEALDAERRWLEDHWLSQVKPDQTR